VTAIMKSFASDNNSGVHPLIMKALAAANAGHALAYGQDSLTERALARFKDIFGQEAEAFFVFLGTAANVLSLKALLKPHQAAICAASAHINRDECGAPESIAGCKLLPVQTEDGKLTVEAVRPFLGDLGFEHHSQPACLSITQSTELGTLYTPEEIRTLADFAHENGLRLHMDGSRLANAAAALGVDLAALSVEAGVDVLSFGGAKNGMMFGEAVVFFEPDLAKDFKYIRKQGMQLASKMRFLAAQFEALLDDELWRKNASAANQAAAMLAKTIKDIPGVRITRPVSVNAVFAEIPPRTVEALRREYFFYIWDQTRTEARFMTSFDTSEEDVAGFAAALRQASKTPQTPSANKKPRGKNS